MKSVSAAVIPGIISVLLTICPSAGQVDEKLLDMSLEELLDMKITTASRSERSIRELPVQVHIITREEIRRNDYKSLVDALKDIPGVRTIQPATHAHWEKFIMRGLYGNEYAKVLVNGIPIRSSVLDALYLSEYISMDNVERIEVVYGPASALYGADALAGIINVITRKPDGEEASLSITRGSAGYVNASFLSTYNVGGMRLNIHGVTTEGRDLNVRTDGDAFNDTDLFGNPVAIGRMPFRNRSIGAELSFKGFSASYDYRYRLNHSSQELYSDMYYYDDPERVYGDAIHQASLRHSHDISLVHLDGYLSYLRYRLDTRSSYGMIFYDSPLYKYMAADDLMLEEAAILDINDNIEVMAGLSILYAGAMPKTSDLEKPFDEDFYRPFSTDVPEQGVYQSTLFGDFGFNPITYYNAAGFLQGMYSNKKLTLSGGLRYDINSEYENKLNPRAAGLYNITDDLSVRAGYNEAYRAPTPYKAYNAFGSVTGYDSTRNDTLINYLHIANPNLEPEKLSAFESGLRYMLTDNISAEMVYTRSRMTALISDNKVGLDTTVYLHAASDSTKIDYNSKDAESVFNSIDLILNFPGIIKPGQISACLYLTLVKGEETLPKGDHVDIFRNVPEVMLKCRVSSEPLKGLYVGVDNIYCSAWYSKIQTAADLDNPIYQSDRYFTMDLTATYDIRTPHGTLGLNTKIINVTDAQYGGVRYLDNPQLSRSFYAGATYSF